MRKYLLHFFVGGTILGSLAYNFYGNILPLSILLTLIFLIIGIIRKDKIFILLSISLLVASLVIWRGISLFTESILSNREGQKIELYGKISNEPDIRDTSTRLVVEVSKMQTKTSHQFLNEKVIVTVPHYPKFQIGEAVKVYGQIQVPDNFENENGIEFDYINFLAKDRIYSLMYYPRIEKIEGSYTKVELFKYKIFQIIFKTKQSFLEQIQKTMPSPEAELLGGILLGTKRSLGKDLEDQFRKTGLIHIVVLSGYNITIIAEAIFRFFTFLPKTFATALGVISILVFAIMVGSGATVIRATIMTFLALIARSTGRTYDVNRALFLAGSIMIFHNPMILLHDPSFQLSFLATFGLINLGNIVKKFLKIIPEKFELREITTATFSTQLTVLPLLMKMTGELSIVAPIVNILTLQVIPITMLLGFIAGLVGFISDTLGIFIGLLPFSFLRYVLFIVNFFANLNFATWKF